MNDKAVSPVIAFLLLLMVVVSFISVLNAYYIPSLKQQAEVIHIEAVEEHFVDLSTKFSPLLLGRKNASIYESIPLGGGNVLFSPIKSSGFMRVTINRDDPYAGIKISIDHNTDPFLNISYNTFNISYLPVGNFWINQGYVFVNGAVYVTKGSKITSLLYTDESDKEEGQIEQSFFSLFLPVIGYNTNGKNLSSITIDLVNLGSLYNSSINGNGDGIIEIRLNRSQTFSSYQTLESGHNCTIDVSNTIPGKFSLLDLINESMEKINTETNNVFWYSGNNTFFNNNPDEESIVMNIQVWNLTVSTYG
jgi:flagellin-like protein